MEDEHRGGATGSIAEHHDLLASQIDALVAHQAKKSVVQGASVDVAELLGEDQTAFTLVLPFVAILF